MNGYELSREWFDWSFENPDLISPNHSALYFFAIEHCNRLGWKEKFGFPTTMAKEAIGIKSYNTYIKTLCDLVDWGFLIMIEKSKNQHSSNIVALSGFNKALDKATTKALDKAMIKHDTKQGESNSSINKPITSNNEPIKPITEITPSANFSFDEFWSLYPNKVAKDKCEPKFNKLSNSDKVKIKNTIASFLANKPFAEYNHPNPLTYLNQKRWNDEVKSNGVVVVPENDNDEEIVIYFSNQKRERNKLTRTKFEELKRAYEGGGWIFYEVTDVTKKNDYFENLK